MRPCLSRGAARAALLIASMFSTCLAAPAMAHVSLQTGEADADSTYKAVLRVPHGCHGEATHTVRVVIPDGVIAVKPMPKAGWTLATRSEAYGRSYVLYGKSVDNGVREVIWSGGQLQDDQYDEFVFQSRLTADLAAGTNVYFPTTQVCANGSVAWTEIPTAGAVGTLASPAPALLIRAADTPQAAAAPVKAGTLTIEGAWSREPQPGSRVSGGFVKITNTGTMPDRLVEASVAFAKRVELHEMAVVDGVMRMRELAKGIEIAPGASVELKPGGLHLMFMEITERPRAGQPVTATLVFEKAGKVEVTFTVQPAAAASRGGGNKHH
ncbi:MAG: DUF1775 domain-containing protein [Hyphomicrobiales bacterium]|nr:DUF1775 domain-containing protein [Hyphomicrobiales bacterium]